jgi:hypothetical protein
VVSEIGCPPDGMEKCVSRGAGNIESGRTASSRVAGCARAHPAWGRSTPPRNRHSGRTRPGTCAKPPADRARNLDRAQSRDDKSVFRGCGLDDALVRSVAQPRAPDQWAAGTSTAVTSRILPGSKDGPQAECWMRIADGLTPLRRRRQRHPQRFRAVSLQERRATVTCRNSPGDTTTGEAGPACDANRQPAGADLAGRSERTGGAAECGDGARRGLVGRRA